MTSDRINDLEAAWVGLGERLDQAGPGDESQFLTRLTLLLAAEIGDSQKFLDLADLALSAKSA
ncbi:hypothetical protein LRS71_23435 [Rhodococcus pyridinivorans]|uniref:hypothetical protein n=1 Tax=Rhodococcus pyridinivorans TaxID=103816 RepID=UPI001E4F39D3|nr:hypothetical protein [Rhodococcus pyridinivorans]MCD5422470.1 hypothetical protein [Rhodococcus pyridinivorans]